MLAAPPAALSPITNPKAIAAFLEAQRQQVERFKDLSKPEGSPHGYLAMMTGCNKYQFIPRLCSDPLCPECSRAKANKRREKWLPVLMDMFRPRMITLTIPDGPDLAERFNYLQKSFRALLDMRIGTRNQVSLECEALSFVEGHLQKQVKAGDKTENQAIQELDYWQKSINKFFVRLSRSKDRAGKWPRMRDLIGPGFASLEITFDTDWHVHRHLCTDGQFIPWPVLAAAWLRVTKNQAKIVDIRAIDKDHNGITEAAKYLTKPWDIPQDKAEAFRLAVRGLKQIWPLGGAKPQEPEHECPYCLKAACTVRLAGHAVLIEAGSLWGRRYRTYEMDGHSSGKVLYVTVIENGDRWEQLPLLDTYRFCVTLAMSKGP